MSNIYIYKYIYIYICIYIVLCYMSISIFIYLSTFLLLDFTEVICLKNAAMICYMLTSLLFLCNKEISKNPKKS